MQNQSNRGSNRALNRGLSPVVPTGDVVGEFTSYLEAVQLVDNIVAGGFAANLIAIVGSDLKSVERVRGRLTYGRVAMNGALNGAWLGLFLGIIFASATSAGAFTNDVIAAAVLGAGLGMIWGVIRMSMRGARRQFISGSIIIAASYQVVVPNGMGGKASEMAAKPQA
ncbi:MAG: hypothetical protein RL196_11 [Actinomycetota bacterium]|jgi:hypothetical protein